MLGFTVMGVHFHLAPTVVFTLLQSAFVGAYVPMVFAGAFVPKVEYFSLALLQNEYDGSSHGTSVSLSMVHSLARDILQHMGLSAYNDYGIANQKSLLFYGAGLLLISSSLWC
ncbi:hypothetical protein U1Q18_000783 [Sarracenia purpurea var. burkii]